MQRLTRLSSLLIAVATASSFCVAAQALNASGNPQELRTKALESWLRGDIDGAEQGYRSAIEEAEHQYGAKSAFVGDLYYEIGTLALENGKFDKAEKWLNTSVELRPNSTMARVKLAQLYRLQRNDPRMGIAHIQQALYRSKGTSLQARQELVSLLMMNNAGVHPVTSTKEAFALKAMVAGQTQVRPPQTKLAMTPIAAVAAAKVEPPKPKPDVVEPKKEPLAVLPVIFKLKPKPEEKKPEPLKVEPPVVKPPVEKPKPVVERPKVKKPKPVVEKPKPVVEKPKPAVEKPKPAVEKPKPEEKPKPQEKPKPAEPLKATPAEPLVVKMPEFKPPTQPTKPAKKSHGMVPPPPPMVPVFGGPPPVMFPPPNPGGFTLQTEAKIKKQAQPKVEKPPPKEEAPKTEPEEKPSAHPVGDPEDPDFLIDWGGVQKKKKGK